MLSSGWTNNYHIKIMKLNSNDLICGIKAKLIRNFFAKHEQIRDPKRLYATDFTALGLSTQKDIRLFIKKLENEGYYAKKTTHNKDIYWERENKALSITNVKFIKTTDEVRQIGGWRDISNAK